MTYELKKMSVWSVAKISFVLGGAFGFVAGLFMWFFTAMLGSLPMDDFGADMGDMGLFGAVGIVLPFVLAMTYAVIIMISNSIMAAVYNLFAGMLGGIELTLNAQQPPASYTPPAPQQYAQPQPPPPPADNPPQPPPASG